MSDRTTTEVTDPNSGDLKVSCEACGYENIEVGQSQNNDRLVDSSNMSDSDLLRKIDQDISAVSSRVEKICIVGGLIIGYWIVSWILALLDVWHSPWFSCCNTALSPGRSDDECPPVFLARRPGGVVTELRTHEQGLVAAGWLRN